MSDRSELVKAVYKAGLALAKAELRAKTAKAEYDEALTKLVASDIATKPSSRP